jgi:hypothetical protein
LRETLVFLPEGDHKALAIAVEEVKKMLATFIQKIRQG